MMRTTIRGTAALVDSLGVLLGFGYLWGGVEETPLLFWGAVVIVLFGALLGALLTPRHVARLVSPSRFILLAAVLCVAVPTVAFVGSLDYGIISGQESFAIFVAVLAGALNWVVFKVVVFPSLAEQPNNTIERDARKSRARPSS